MSRILIKKDFRRPDFDSAVRQTALEELAGFGQIDDYAGELTADNGGTDVVAVIASSLWIHEDFYDANPQLRIIARYGVGYEKVRVELCTQRGILVTCAPEHMVTVAEYTIAQWMATLKRLYTLNRNAHSGDGKLMVTYEAAGTTLGLYGFGRIGQAVAERAVPLLGAEGTLLVYDVRDDIGELAARFGAEAVADPMELFRRSDAVSLHLAGDEPVVGRRELSVMQPHATLLNPSRGNLVVDADVKQALDEGHLFYYVIDDPVRDGREIYRDHPRVIATNHNAGITAQSAARLDRRTVSQVIDALESRLPPHVLNPEVLEHPRLRDLAAG
jgi:phosphoglycerate dehydrogenase-like enzyme